MLTKVQSRDESVRTILIVDDSKDVLLTIEVVLRRHGFNVLQAEDGAEAINILACTLGIEAVVLDRVMPGIDGMEVMRFLKDSERLSSIPVILQTALVDTQYVLEGIKAGCYYYLTKPYDPSLLPAIVNAAIRDSAYDQDLDYTRPLGSLFKDTLREGTFEFSTLEEAKNIAFLIASCFRDRKIKYYGLSELMVNAIEHGNLGITYEEKRSLILKGAFDLEIERRLALKDNKGKSVKVTFQRTDSKATISIEDQGSGFDWKRYMLMSPDRITDPNGRGICVFAVKAFTKLEYQGSGNVAVCTQLHDI